MSETKLATKADLKEMYDRMLPYLGGMPEVLANKFSKGDLYSTDEKMIGQWVDGKPLYQRTVIAAISGGTTEGKLYYKQIDVSSLSIDSFISCNACLKGSNICITLPSFEYVASFGRCYFIYAGSSTTLQININEANATLLNLIKESSAYVTLQYTKTTDSAISIGSDTDYSTDEKIVGTWIDGKPLYQCTTVITDLPSENMTQTQSAASNIDNVVDIKGVLVGKNGMVDPIPKIQDNSTTLNMAIDVLKSTGKIQLKARTTTDVRQNWEKAYVTIQYTKTTS